MTDIKVCKRCDCYCSINMFIKSNKSDKWIGNTCRVCRAEVRLERYHTVEKYDVDQIKTNRNRASEWFKDNEKKHKDTCRNWRNSTDKGYWNNKITSIKANARHRGLEVDLKRIDLEKLFDIQEGKCAISGRELMKTRVKSSLDTCSVDRIDNSKGYIPENIRLVTLQANLAKHTGNDEELLAFCKDVILHSELVSRE